MSGRPPILVSTAHSILCRPARIEIYLPLTNVGYTTGRYYVECSTIFLGTLRGVLAVLERKPTSSMSRCYAVVLSSNAATLVGKACCPIITERELPGELVREILDGINRGEGLTNPQILRGNLALQVREVENGSIRSYRLFPAERFSLELQDDATRAKFVEHVPSGLLLRYLGDHQNDAELLINLDVFEMLQRLNAGYRPSVEEEQGYYLSLAVFKNVLGSAPYQDVLLTTTGHDFFRVERLSDGRLEMSRSMMEVG